MDKGRGGIIARSIGRRGLLGVSYCGGSRANDRGGNMVLPLSRGFVGSPRGVLRGVRIDDAAELI